MGIPAVWRRGEKSIAGGPRCCFLSAAARSRLLPPRRGGRLSASASESNAVRPPRRLVLAFALSVTALAFLAVDRSLLAYDWLQFNGDSAHSGNDTRESILTASNAAALVFAFQATLPAVADGAPVYLSAVSTPGGTRDLLFLTTKAGHILALDAHTGSLVWSHQYAAGSCRINGGSSPCYTTSSPAIDPNRQFVYGYGLDGNVHKYRVGDGGEILTGGWPETATLKGFDEKGSSALAIATSAAGTSYLYMAHGGYPGDNGDYQGHITAINLADGSQRVFNSLCSDQAVHFVTQPGSPGCARAQSAIWARPGVVYDSVTDRIYMGTGNGLYDANTGGRSWGDSVFSLTPDGSGSGGNPLDSYTPTSFQALQNADADLGSTAPAILPAPGFPGRLAVQGGKDSTLRLLDLTNLSGMGGPGHVGGELQALSVPQGGVVLTTPAVWSNPADGNTWVFVVNGNGSSGSRVSVVAGIPSLVPQWQNSRSGSSPVVANNVLYSAGTGIVRAVNPADGSLLWSDSRVGGIHWESPIVANGMLYVPDESAHLTAYFLPRGDFNVDGKTDLLWRHSGSGADAVWTMNGTSQSSVVNLPLTSDGSWKIVGAADFNGDGKTDILWRNTSTGANAVWLMNGAAVSSVVNLPAVADTNWRIVATADFNGDGKADILWRHATLGLDGIWLMNGTTFTGSVALPAMTDTGWEIAGAGDFNGDGSADILWRHSLSGINGVWFMNGTAFMSSASLPLVSDTGWKIRAVGDFNADGKPDIVWRHSASGNNAIWLMNGTAVSSVPSLPIVTDAGWDIVGPR